MDKIQIRLQRPEDEAAVWSVVSAAFGRDNEARLVEALRQADESARLLSIVAEAEGCIVGQIQFSPIHIARDGGDGSNADAFPCLSLAPLAVHPDFQNQGIGSALTRFGLDLARQQGHRIVLVLGHPDYYPRFGFDPRAASAIQCPFGDVGEAWMALALQAGALQGVQGRAVYPPIFSEV